MTFLVTFYVDGDSVDDDCFPSFDEACSAKYGWQSEDESNHYADIQLLDDDEHYYEVDFFVLDHLVKAFFGI